MTEPTKLTEEQTNEVMDILGDVEERKDYNRRTKTYSLKQNESDVFEKCCEGMGPYVDVNGMIMKLDLKKLKVKLLKMPETDQEESTKKAPEKKKASAKKTTKKASAKKSTKKAETIEEAPIKMEKPLSDKNPLILKPGDDFLVWVGYYSYPKIADYVNEAMECGFLKKVRQVPAEGFEEGSTRIFIAHNEGFDGLGVIIGYCMPEIKKGKIGEYPKRRDKQEMSDTNATYLTGKFEVFEKLVNIKGEPKTKKFIPVDGKVIIKSKNFTSSPSSRADVPIKVEMKKAKSRWTNEDRKELAKFVKANATNPNKFREFAMATGRSVRSVEYQWYGPMKKAGMH